ncbi:MAG: hypothetical protein ACE5IW_13415 [bacterium]
MAELLNYIEKLTRETKKSEAELMTLAFQTGLRQLWREHVLGRYLRGEISREKAVEMVGIDWVELAEHQHEAMMEDLAWALEK